MSFLPYIAALRIAIKENIQFLGNWLDALITPPIYLFLLYSIWTTLFPQSLGELLPYAIIVSFIIEETRIRDLSSDYSERILRGWDQSFTKPVVAEMFVHTYSLGKILFYRLPALLLGEVAILIMLGPKAALLGLVAYLANICLQFFLSYLISSLAYWTHTTWGISLIIGISITILGGFAIPLSFLSHNVRAILDMSPFPYFYYYNAQAVITQDPAIIIKLLLNTLLWSALFFSIGYVLHRRGRKRFESFGG